MRQVNVHEAKTQLSALLEAVESGESVVIARAGKPVAVLTAYRTTRRKRRLGLFKGQGRIAADFDELPADIAAAFEGDGT
jgi:prevent-host-death family protein